MAIYSKLNMLIVMVFLLFSLSSCSSFSNGGTTITKNDFRKGYSDIEFDFIKDTLPDEISEDSLFSIGLRVKNEGASDVQEGLLVVNYDGDYIQLFGNGQKRFSLEGKNEFNPKGEESEYFFEGKSGFLDLDSKERAVPMMASVCYLYETVLEDTLCIDKSYQTNADVGEKICDVKDERYSGQGGSVGVSEVKLSVLVDEQTNMANLVFDIIVEHRGNGFIADYDNYRAMCSGRNSVEDDYNVVKIKEITLSENPLDCGKDEIMLQGDEGRIKCSLPYSIPQYQMPYQAPFKIVLEYAYSDIITDEITIKHYN